jgi:hypothetical protein
MNDYYILLFGIIKGIGLKINVSLIIILYTLFI